MIAILIIAGTWFIVAVSVAINLGRHLGVTGDHDYLHDSLLYAVFWPIAAPMWLAFKSGYQTPTNQQEDI